METKLTCSNCGAEVSNLNMASSKRYALIPLVFMVVAFVPLIKIWFFKADATKDLKISQIQKTVTAESIDVTGLITNEGRHRWSSVYLEAEFFDKAGNFLGEESERISSDIIPEIKEHFKVSITNRDARLRAPDVRMELKIASAFTSSF